MTTFSEFLGQYAFKPANAFKLGVEREFFLADAESEIIVPKSYLVLQSIQDSWRDFFTYELSACQIENRTRPTRLEDLPEHLFECDSYLDKVLHGLGLRKLYLEVAPADMSLEVFPDPLNRYQEIKQKLSPEQFEAACRIAGTHFHVGMPDQKTALKVYNQVIKHLKKLCAMGDNSGGERLRLYGVVKPDNSPPPYDSWTHFHQVALLKGFAGDSKDCWFLMRLTKHGTIEFRMFGVTDSVEEVTVWARFCHDICLDASAGG